jgi:hypothetical protein
MCSFKGSHLKSVNLTGACLQGADFSEATLDGASMTGAAVAKTAGTLALAGHRTLPRTLEYDRGTVVADSSTNETTKCPNGQSGMCTGDMWTSKIAPMTSWTWGPKS